MKYIWDNIAQESSKHTDMIFQENRFQFETCLVACLLTGTETPNNLGPFCLMLDIIYGSIDNNEQNPTLTATHKYRVLQLPNCYPRSFEQRHFHEVTLVRCWIEKIPLGHGILGKHIFQWWRRNSNFVVLTHPRT